MTDDTLSAFGLGQKPAQTPAQSTDTLSAFGLGTSSTPAPKPLSGSISGGGNPPPPMNPADFLAQGATKVPDNTKPVQPVNPNQTGLLQGIIQGLQPQPKAPTNPQVGGSFSGPLSFLNKPQTPQSTVQEGDGNELLRSLGITPPNVQVPQSQPKLGQSQIKPQSNVPSIEDILEWAKSQPQNTDTLAAIHAQPATAEQLDAINDAIAKVSANVSPVGTAINTLRNLGLIAPETQQKAMGPLTAVNKVGVGTVNPGSVAQFAGQAVSQPIQKTLEQAGTPIAQTLYPSTVTKDVVIQTPFGPVIKQVFDPEAYASALANTALLAKGAVELGHGIQGLKGEPNAIQEQSPNESVLRQGQSQVEMQGVDQGNTKHQITPEQSQIHPSIQEALNTWKDYIQPDLDRLYQDIQEAPNRAVAANLKLIAKPLQDAIDTNTPPPGLIESIAKNHAIANGLPLPDVTDAGQAAQFLRDNDEDHPDVINAMAEESGHTPDEIRTALDYHRNTATPESATSGDTTGTASEPRSTVSNQVTQNAVSGETSAPVSEASTPITTEPGTEPQATGLANQVQNREAAQGIISPVDSGHYPTLQEIQEQGKQSVENGTDPNKLLRDIEDSGRAATDKDFGVLLEGKRLQEKAINDLNRQIEGAVGADKTRLIRQRDAAQASLNDYVQRIQPLKTQAGQTLYSLQAGSTIDEGNYAQVIQRIAEQKGHVSEADTKLMSKSTAELDKAEQQIKSLEDQHAKQIEDLKTKHEQELKDAQAKKLDVTVRKLRDKSATRAQLQAERNSIISELARVTSKVSANPIDVIPHGFELLGKLALNCAKEGVLTLDDLYNKVKPHLDSLGITASKDDMVKALTGSQRIPTPIERTSVDEIQKQARIQQDINDIKNNVTRERKTPNPNSPEVQRLLNEKKGLTPKNELQGPPTFSDMVRDVAKKGASKTLDELLEQVRQTSPDATKQDVVDALNQTAKKNPTSQEALLSRELRNQAKTQADIYDLENQIKTKQFKEQDEVNRTQSQEMQELTQKRAALKSFIRQWIRAQEPTNIAKTAAEVSRGVVLGPPSIGTHIALAGPGTLLMKELGQVPASIRNFVNDSLYNVSKGKVGTNQIARGGADIQAIKELGKGFVQGLKEAPGKFWKGENSIETKLNTQPDEYYGSHGFQVPAARIANIVKSPRTATLQDVLKTVEESAHSVGAIHGAIQQPFSMFPSIRRSILEQAQIASHNLPESELQALHPSLENLTGKELRYKAKQFLVNNPTDSMYHQGLEEGIKNSMMQDNTLTRAMSSFRNTLNLAAKTPTEEGLPNNAAKLGSAAITYAMPVAKPATNAAFTAAEFSPLGLGRGLSGYADVAIKQMIADAKNKGKAGPELTGSILNDSLRNLDQTQRATLQRLMDNGLVGTAMTTLGAYMYAKHLINSDYQGPEDKQRLQQAKQGKENLGIAGKLGLDTNKGLGTLNIGDYGIPLHYLGSLGTALRIGADLQSAHDVSQKKNLGLQQEAANYGLSLLKNVNPAQPIVSAAAKPEKVLTGLAKKPKPNQ